MDRIDQLSELVTAHPGDAFARYGLAMAFASAGRTEEALEEFDTLIVNTPDYVPAYQMSSQHLIKLGRTGEARTQLTAGLAACARTNNTHAASEMQAMLDELA